MNHLQVQKVDNRHMNINRTKLLRLIAFVLANIMILTTPVQAFASTYSMGVEIYAEDNDAIQSSIEKEDDFEVGTSVLDGENDSYEQTPIMDIDDSTLDQNTSETVSIILSHNTLELERATTAALTALAYNSVGEIVDTEIDWSSNDSNIVEVDGDGMITAKSAGQTVIAASCGEASAECIVTVVVPITGVILDRESISLQKDQSAQLIASVQPIDITDTAEFYWSSSDENIVVVDDTGKITGKKAGQATIKVECDEFFSQCIVTVTAPIISVSLDRSEVFLKKNQKINLKTTISPTDTTDDITLVWSSNDSRVATVNADGIVTGLNAGQAEIKVEDNKHTVKDVCIVKVSSEEWYTGWRLLNGNWYYYDSDGNIQTGWQQVSGKWYYLGSDGTMRKGWQKISEKWFYLDSSGARVTGWLCIGKTWYYLNADGVMQTGWQNVSDKWYYLNNSGAMQIGWIVVGGIRYYLEKSGELQTGWIKWNGSWYYYDANGNRKTGWQQVSGKWYYLNSNGVMQIGWLRLDNKWYYLKSGGDRAVGWLKLGKIWYYFKTDGVMVTGWLKLGSSWYYLNSSGAMATGWTRIGGVWYYLKDDGAMVTGWLKLGSTWYYLSSSGAMATGWLKLGNAWYYLQNSGAMVTGWLKLGNNWYYLDGSGAMATGWLKVAGLWYYFDGNGVMQAGNSSGPLTFRSGNVFRMKSCEGISMNGNQMTVSLRVARNNTLESLSSVFYIVMLNSTGTELLEVAVGNVTKGDSFQINATFNSSDYFRTMMMSQYAIAVKTGYSYQVISDMRFLENPDITVSADKDFKDKYWGYYENYKVTSKKGIQGVHSIYTEDLKAQHLLLNVDIQDLIWIRPASGYVPYNYKGKTYYFSDLIALKKTVYDLHGWGSKEGNSYGENHTRNVTLVLLLSWKYDELSYLIHPKARNKGAAPYYAMNMLDTNARETYEALFCYLGEEFGQMKERVNNWTLGNEVNSCNAWNYSGGMSLEECVKNYAQAFQLLNQGIKRTANSPRLFISLDHCWNAADAGHGGKEFLDQFAEYMNQTAPKIKWNVNYHPYSQPLNNCTYWNDYSNTTDSVNTRYISMRNIQVLTTYLGTLESKYGIASNSIRVILGEIGYSGSGGNSNAEKYQAAALGYGYYIAMFNKRIDSYIIRAYLDDSAETAAGLYLGLRRKDSAQTAKESYDVYKNLDGAQSLEKMNAYLSLIGISSWQNVISGFDAGELPAKSF